MLHPPWVRATSETLLLTVPQPGSLLKSVSRSAACSVRVLQPRGCTTIGRPRYHTIRRLTLHIIIMHLNMGLKPTTPSTTFTTVIIKTIRKLCVPIPVHDWWYQVKARAALNLKQKLLVTEAPSYNELAWSASGLFSLQAGKPLNFQGNIVQL